MPRKHQALTLPQKRVDLSRDKDFEERLYDRQYGAGATQQAINEAINLKDDENHPI